MAPLLSSKSNCKGPFVLTSTPPESFLLWLTEDFIQKQFNGTISPLFTREIQPADTQQVLFSYLLFCNRSVLDVVTDTTLVTESYYLCSPVIEELPVLRISSDFGAVVHSTKYDPIDEAHFLQQHL